MRSESLPAISSGDLPELVRDRLSTWPRLAAPSTSTFRRAAVVVALTEPHGIPHFVVIKRVARGTNAGQWALPGGRLDPGETAVDAGLRELHEEVGLDVSPESVLGMLDDFTTDSGYVITPLVVAVPAGQRIRRNPHEVHSVHPIAVNRLLAEGVPRWTRPTDDAPALLQLPLRHDMIVHAPTGAILWQFAEVALRGRANRVVDCDQPAFTST